MHRNKTWIVTTLRKYNHEAANGEKRLWGTKKKDCGSSVTETLSPGELKTYTEMCGFSITDCRINPSTSAPGQSITPFHEWASTIGQMNYLEVGPTQTEERYKVYIREAECWMDTWNFLSGLGFMWSWNHEPRIQSSW